MVYWITHQCLQQRCLHLFLCAALRRFWVNKTEMSSSEQEQNSSSSLFLLNPELSGIVSWFQFCPLLTLLSLQQNDLNRKILHVSIVHILRTVRLLWGSKRKHHGHRKKKDSGIPFLKIYSTTQITRHLRKFWHVSTHYCTFQNANYDIKHETLMKLSKWR